MIDTKQVLRWATVAVLIISAGLLALRVWGYGHATVELPAGTIVQINGHAMPAGSQSLKLRPGTYHIATNSARYFSKYETFHVSLLRTTTYRPTLTQRTPESIAYAVTTVSNTEGPAPVSSTLWLGDNWLVETVGFSTPRVIAADFHDGRWYLAYASRGTTDISTLPSNVATVVRNLEASTYATQ